MKYWRTNLILILILVFGATIIGRLIFLQIIQYQYWSALAKGQQKIFTNSLGERGEIFLQDREGNLYKIATNRDYPFVFASPKEIPPEKLEETAEILSQNLNLDKNLLLEKLKNKESFYELIKKKLTDEELENIKKLNLPGISLGKEKNREYPRGSLAAHLLGFLGGDGLGQYGLEGYWDSELRGKEVLLEGQIGPRGYLFLSAQAQNSEIRGGDFILTVDYNIQYQAEKLLKQAKEQLDIEEGQIIILEPNSGKVLALANFPSFDPNYYSEETDLEIFKNGAIQKIFEPGSVFKPITMAVALDQGKITPQTTYEDQGFLKIGGYTIYNYDGRVWGQRTMTEVLEKSINTGAVFAQRQIGSNEVFLDYIKAFGIFEKTGIDLQGEISSQNRELQKGYEINFATASFGQGIEMTPIQLARAFSAIANGGKLIKPYLVEKIIKNGQVIDPTPKFGGGQIISQRTASQLTAMMVSVVENGFAKATKIPGYYIAGKTGTAQIAFSALGIPKSGYSEKTIQSFIGFAPAFNPRFLILVKLNNPKTKTAEYSAVPIFRELAKYIIDYWQIPPDYQPR